MFTCCPIVSKAIKLFRLATSDKQFDSRGAISFSDDFFTDILPDDSCLKCLSDIRQLEASSLGRFNLFRRHLRLIHCQVHMYIRICKSWILNQWTFRLLVSRYDSADINEIRAPRGDIIVAIHVKRNVFRHSPGNQSREISFRFTSRQRIGSQIYYPQNILIKLIVEYEREFWNNWGNDGLARNTKRRSPNNNFNNSIDSCYHIRRSNGMRI